MCSNRKKRSTFKTNAVKRRTGPVERKERANHDDDDLEADLQNATLEGARRTWDIGKTLDLQAENDDEEIEALAKGLNPKNDDLSQSKSSTRRSRKRSK